MTTLPDPSEIFAICEKLRVIHTPNSTRIRAAEAEMEKMRKEISQKDADLRFWKNQALKNEADAREWQKHGSSCIMNLIKAMAYEQAVREGLVPNLEVSM